jgi:hypothetical protein
MLLFLSGSLCALSASPAVDARIGAGHRIRMHEHQDGTVLSSDRICPIRLFP